MQDKETVKIDMLNLNSDIYDRQKRIHDFDQSALSQGNVLIIGAGALGNECTKNLCQAGIGRMTLVDFDNIEVSNLNRCVWYTHDDIGSPKAIVLKDKLSSQFTDISINAITQRFEDMDEQLLIDADVVVSCVDSMDTRLTINSYCMDFSIPLVDGGTEAFSGRVQTVIPGTTACLECGRREVKQKIMNARYRCGELIDVFERPTAAISTTTSVVGAYQANEVIKLLQLYKSRLSSADADQQRLLSGKYFSIDLHTNYSKTLNISVDPACPLH